MGAKSQNTNAANGAPKPLAAPAATAPKAARPAHHRRYWLALLPRTADSTAAITMNATE